MARLNRLDNWASILNETIESKRDKPFEWGEHDCCLFAADCIDAITGSSFAERFRGKYKTEKGAYGLLKKFGGIEGIFDHFLDPMPISFAMRGDVVRLNTQGHPIGIVALSGKDVACVGKYGLCFVPISTAIKLWRA